MTHADTARRLSALFYTAENGNLCIGGEGDDTEVVKDMVRAADMSGLGWDFAYEAVRDGLDHIADTDNDPNDSDTAAEFANGAVDVYTVNLINWLHSAPILHGPLCDQAAEDLGYTEYQGLEKHIQLGQYTAYTYAMQAITENWPTDDAWQDEDNDDDSEEEDSEAG
jgi:hypothetical protein